MSQTARYTYVTVHGCPIAPPSGKLPLHRLVLFAKIGPGPHPCFRCGEPVDWSDEGTAPGALTVNHMDNDPRNNSWGNLEPACHSCNIEHGRDPRFEGGLFLVVNGKRSKAVERVCQRESCGKTFLVEKKHVRYAERVGRTVGRYCSQDCRWGR